jgi:hypothetical protein
MQISVSGERIAFEQEVPPEENIQHAIASAIAKFIGLTNSKGEYRICMRFKVADVSELAERAGMTAVFFGTLEEEAGRVQYEADETSAVLGHGEVGHVCGPGCPGGWKKR